MAELAYPIQNKHSRQNRRNHAKPALAQSSYKSSYSYMPRCRPNFGPTFSRGGVYGQTRTRPYSPAQLSRKRKQRRAREHRGGRRGAVAVVRKTITRNGILGPFFPHRTSLHRDALTSRNPLICYGWGQLRYACRRKALQEIPEQSITTCNPEKLTIARQIVRVDRQTGPLRITTALYRALRCSQALHSFRLAQTLLHG